MLGVTIDYETADAVTVANLKNYRQTLIDIGESGLLPEDDETNEQTILAIDLILTHFDRGTLD